MQVVPKSHPVEKTIMAATYPQVVVRYMATVYSYCPVRFVAPQEVRPDLEQDTDAFVIACPIPFVDGQLTAQARHALIDAVQEACRQSRHRMCAVFGESDCVYCESDGASEESVEPPSGGIQSIRFPLQRKEPLVEGDPPP